MNVMRRSKVQWLLIPDYLLSQVAQDSLQLLAAFAFADRFFVDKS